MTDPVQALSALNVPEGWSGSQSLVDLIIGRLQRGGANPGDMVGEAQYVDQLLDALTRSQLEVIHHIGTQQQGLKNLKGLGDALKNFGKSG